MVTVGTLHDQFVGRAFHQDRLLGQDQPQRVVARQLHEIVVGIAGQLVQLHLALRAEQDHVDHAQLVQHEAAVGGDDHLLGGGEGRNLVDQLGHA
ncbi:hypothetical protein G6F68_018942 [Rhizopus microsporus]|nr:hypothetical protein G6F68_018942 [Rhizopus microsporus]